MSIQILSFKPVHPVFVIALFCSAWLGCSRDGAADAPDVRRLKVEAPIRRFERDLFALDTNQLEAGLQGLGQQFPQMLPLFSVHMIHDQTNPSETPLQAVKNFLSAPPVRALNDTVQQHFGDLKPLQSDLNQMFRYYAYYFPEKPIPQVCTVVTEFATDAFTYGDSLCGIGLDMYLGTDFEGYDPEIFPAYLRRQFRPEYMTVRLAKALAGNLAGQAPGERLVDQMLHNGKILYVVDKLLPAVPDSLKMGYTRQQMEGAVANEQGVWARILELNLLYSTDSRKIRKLVEPSPNAQVVFLEAPGEIGNWMGWQIVSSYMKAHPGTTVPQLLALRDSQKLLEAARYRPRRQ